MILMKEDLAVRLQPDTAGGDDLVPHILCFHGGQLLGGLATIFPGDWLKMGIYLKLVIFPDFHGNITNIHQYTSIAYIYIYVIHAY